MLYLIPHSTPIRSFYHHPYFTDDNWGWQREITSPWLHTSGRDRWQKSRTAWLRSPTPKQDGTLPSPPASPLVSLTKVGIKAKRVFLLLVFRREKLTQFSMRHWPLWESKGPTAFRPTLRGWCSLRDEMKDWVFIINVLSDSILETPEKGFHLLALSRGNCLF